MAAKWRTSNSSGAFFSEHSEMLALPVFYLLGCQRRTDSAAGFHPAVPALAREMHLQLPLLVVHELELFFVAGGYFYRVHRLARAAPVERLAAVDSLVFYINNITMCFDPVRMTDRVKLVLFYLQRFIQKAPSTPVNEIS